MLEHGGNLRDAIRQFHYPKHAWIDLSAGLNPHFYTIPDHTIEASNWHRLPEPSDELLCLAKAYYQCEHILPIAGSQAAIQALPRMLAHGLLPIPPMRRVVISAPSYAEHVFQWRQVQQFHVMEAAYNDLATAIDEADVMVICNPNNPTGAMIAKDTLLSWAEKLAHRGGYLIVDEAFIDMQVESSVAPYAHYPNLIVLRSFGKFFGLAGLRLGFAIADQKILMALQNYLGPWTISGPAQAIATLALADNDWQQTTRLLLKNEGQRLRQLFTRYVGVSEGTDLFQWCSDEQLQSKSEDFWRYLAEHGIWSRLFLQSAKGVRLGLPANENAWQRLELVLSQWKNNLITY